MELHTLLIVGHIIGTILGAGGATIAEVQINVALKDGKVDPQERALMHANYWMIRVGILFIIVSGGLLVWSLYNSGQEWALTSPKAWIKEIMTAAIIFNAIALSKKWVPLWLGAGISFASWWGATILGIFGQLPFTFTEYVFGYIVFVLLVSGALHLIRKIYLRKPKEEMQ